MHDWARDMMHGSGAGELINLSYVDGLMREHREGRADHSRKIWTVLVFCVWHAVFVSRTLQPALERNQSALVTKPVVGTPIPR
jgi:asparagine synthase (glutamine-hydrolysing)